MKQMLHTKAIITKANIEEAGVIKGVIGSSAVIDRMGDIIAQEGWELKDFKTNPVILWAHNAGFGTEDRPPIAKAVKVWVEGKGTKSAKLMFDLKFDLQDSFAAEIYRKIKEGFLNTVSVGFLPHEWEELDPDNWWGGLKFTKQDLLELSIVPVPANPEALIQLNSFSKSDKRFTPVTEKQAFKQVEDNRYKKMMQESKEVSDEKVAKVNDNEIVVELRSISDFEEGTFRALKMKKNDKDYFAIIGKVKDTGAMVEQSLRYSKDKFTEEEVKADDSTTTPTNEEEKEPGKVDETVSEREAGEAQKTEDEVPDPKTKVEAEGDTNGDGVATVDDQKEDEEVTADEEVDKAEELKNDLKSALGQIIKSGRVISAKNEAKLTQASGLIDEVLAGLEKEEVIEDEDDGTTTGGKENDFAKVLPYKSLGICADSESFDAPGEIAKSTPAELAEFCTYYDPEKADDKSEYKLIHHRQSDKKAVWRGVASSMALLMGAKGGVGISEEDQEAVYNHLIEHYKEFGKEVPALDLVKSQVLANLDEEVHALTLDREDKHMVRLIKKILDNQKEEKKTVNSSTQVQALEVIDKALSKVNIRTGGDI